MELFLQQDFRDAALGHIEGKWSSTWGWYKESGRQGGLPNSAAGREGSPTAQHAQGQLQSPRFTRNRSYWSLHTEYPTFSHTRPRRAVDTT